MPNPTLVGAWGSDQNWGGGKKKEKEKMALCKKKNTFIFKLFL